MDYRSRELLKRAAECLGRRGQNMPDLLLADEIHKYLRGDNDERPAFESRVDEWD